MTTEIHSTLYDPTKSLFKASGNDKAKLTVISCANPEGCEAFAAGKCAEVGMIFGGRQCPHSSFKSETGFTKRARKFREWISDKKEAHKDTLYALKAGPKRIFMVDGGYVMNAYSHINMNPNVPWKSKSNLFMSGMAFLKTEDVTAEALKSIVEYRPQAMIGGEITSYQLEVVPKFIKDLMVHFPELFELLCSVKPELKERYVEVSAIGRKALLSTVRPGPITFGKDDYNVWDWDGEHLTSSHTRNLWFEKFASDEVLIRCKPKSNVEIVIEREDQVDSNTQFTD